MKTVLNLKPGESGIIKKFHGQGALKKRFSDMGIVKGTGLTFIKTAPLGDPIQISIKNYELTIRKEDAKDVELE